jgi:hypothetical protein
MGSGSRPPCKAAAMAQHDQRLHSLLCFPLQDQHGWTGSAASRSILLTNSNSNCTSMLDMPCCAAALQIIALVMSRGVLVHVPQRYWRFVAASCLPVIPESGATSRHCAAASLV